MRQRKRAREQESEREGGVSAIESERDREGGLEIKFNKREIEIDKRRTKRKTEQDRLCICMSNHLVLSVYHGLA